MRPLRHRRVAIHGDRVDGRTGSDNAVYYVTVGSPFMATVSMPAPDPMTRFITAPQGRH